ncbi:SDR family oxidoreductase [Tengunoibacter tsumagoiensis]|uniref:Short-chain dehydrogenase n=1 Tax=Tengunoibacter tsumagoiensis TaxID=2014871 RepID=A0A401ZZU2_9CHLR|nr:SDR family oxidoreductase [Tengunoibacter tsumagoiensis]GCE12311.1 short-chain dehydrogenase [Tengunoibacter tsumagoiensis]
MRKLENQVAVITGSGSGIGQATALAFAREGASVVVADTNLQAAQETVSLIHTQEQQGTEPLEGARAAAFHANVTAATDASALIAFTIQTFGRIDILVNNAGIGVTGTVLTTSEEDWDRIFAVNVKGIFQCSRAAIPQMIEQGAGVIINVSSIVALVAVVDRAAYGASKGAVLALTKAMAADHVKDNIRVNCVCPGTIDTPWVGQMVQSYADPEDARRKMVARQPVGRLGTAEEVAAAILYLVSPEAAFATGSALVIDGGFTAFKLPV